MNEREREERIETLTKLMSQRRDLRVTLHETLQEFSTRLFEALESVLQLMQENNVPGLGKYRRLPHPAAQSQEAFQCFIQDWSIIFVPLPGFARPNLVDEALIDQYLFKQPCGRIGVFLSDAPQSTAFYDFLVFEDRSWFAWGYGWPRQQADIQHTDFEELALELIHSFVKDIFTTWQSREQTVLAQALDAKKRCFIFGLPGEEQQGGG